MGNIAMDSKLRKSRIVMSCSGDVGMSHVHWLALTTSNM